MNPLSGLQPNARSVLSAVLAVALLGIQFAAIRFAPSEPIVRVVLPATIALVPLALWVHRGHVGVWVIFVGLAANLCAILANGGLMPIERSTVAAGGRRRAGRGLHDRRMDPGLEGRPR